MFAVLTGDLIESRKASPADVDRAMGALRAAALALGDLHRFDPRFTRHRGDGWQIALPLPAPLLDICLAMQASLGDGPGTRIAVGIGALARLGSTDLSDAGGEAFVRSGDLLETLGARGQPRMALDGAAVTDWMRGAVQMADWIAQGWTAGQAEAVARVLTRTAGPNAAHARALGISRQSFERRLRGAGLDAMEIARAAFAAQDWAGT